MGGFTEAFENTASGIHKLPKSSSLQLSKLHPFIGTEGSRAISSIGILEQSIGG
jgi:hypothetical protein